MVLLIDIGNTTVAISEVDMLTKGIKKGYRTVTSLNEDYTDFLAKNLCDEPITKCLVCSVVPLVTASVCDSVSLVYNIIPYVLTHDDIPMKICVYAPEKVGIDRLVDAYYSYSLYKLPAVTIDLGTASTIGVVTEEGFMGGVISAGVETSLSAIGSRAAQLFRVDPYVTSSVIGKNTEQCLNIGAVYGTAVMIDGIVSLIEREIGQEVKLYITGGYSGLIEKLINHSYTLEPNMIVRGMMLYK